MQVLSTVGFVHEIGGIAIAPDGAPVRLIRDGSDRLHHFVAQIMCIILPATPVLPRLALDPAQGRGESASVVPE
ncbi:hypothetical protein [Palleronia marisminoris]|uniref:hypothetical protein n=1 Tax=Palleronia marisminoris TaxID=315423 RepID=UPI000A27067E|nr:hypothetical protein [Palleronia marisminoris]